MATRCFCPPGKAFHRLIYLVQQAYPLQQRVCGGDAGLSEQAADCREKGHVRQTGVEHILAAGSVFHQRVILIDRADGGLNGAALSTACGFKMDAANKNFSGVTQKCAVENTE